MQDTPEKLTKKVTIDYSKVAKLLGDKPKVAPTSWEYKNIFKAKKSMKTSAAKKRGVADV